MKTNKHNMANHHDNINKLLLKITNCSQVTPINELYKELCELQKIIKVRQTLTRRLADIHNIGMESYKARNIVARSNKKFLDPKPSDICSVSLFNKEEKTIIDDVKLPVITVPTLSHVPMSKLYYVEELGQYVVNINGFNCRGNIGDIVERNTVRSRNCKNGNTCENLLKELPCNFYHDPKDILKIKLKIPDIYKNQRRHFTNGSWIYSRKHNHRKISSRNQLQHDLIRVSPDMANDFMYQTMHDILVWLTAAEKISSKKYLVSN